MESGSISWKDPFCDTNTETKRKTFFFSTLVAFLYRSNLRLIFLVHLSLAVFWVSLKVVERSEDTVNSPLTLIKLFSYM